MNRSYFLKRMLPFLLALDLALFPAAVLAGPNIPGFYGGMGNLVQPSANTLPVIQNIVSGVSGLEQVGNNRLIIRQDEDKAIVEWKSFDIGANAWTHFDQKGNTSWSALNRIYDHNPSQIFGRLTANGNVFLINQNGLLFSPGAAVDVHGLVASSLNIAHDAFLDDLLTFEAQNYQGADDYDALAVAVANHGTIRTDDNGSVMLISPTVENSGTIESPLGRIILASGTDVTMEEQITGARVNFLVDAGGDSQKAVNHQDGRLQADLGQIGMYGRFVNQEGLIRSVTAVSKNGRIELKAKENLAVGEHSLTESPISTSGETIVSATEFTGGELTFSSEDLIDFQGEAIAPAGSITFHAANRVYLDADSRIDVSGSWITKPAQAAVASAQLNSVELKDDHQQKQGLLQGETVAFNVVEGSGIGDASGTLTVEEQTALESSTAGGEIELLADNGEMIARSGATLNFSGGGIIYDQGFTETTVLVSGNRLYPIKAAPDWIAYDDILGPDQPLTTTSQRFGVSEAHDGTYHMGSANAMRNFNASYHEGSDAGSLVVQAPVVVLNATVDGSVNPGVYQTNSDEKKDANGNQSSRGIKRPAAGRMIIGGPFAGGFWEDRDPVVQRMMISSKQSLLEDDFDATSPFPASWAEVSPLSAERFNESGLREIILSVREAIVVEEEVAIAMAPSSSLTLAGRHIEHHGSITIPEGQVDLILASNLTSDANNSQYVDDEALGFERIYLAQDSRIDLSGQQVDLSQAAQLNGALSDPGFTAGGDVRLVDETVAGEGVVVMPGAVIDVGGGWRIDQQGRVTGGDAGSIELAGSGIILEGDLAAHALADAKGGQLNLHAQQVTVTANTPPSTLSVGFGPTDALTDDSVNHLIISDKQIDRTGATSIELAGITDLTVDNGVTLSPSTLKLSDPNVDAKDINGEIFNNAFSESAADPPDGEGLIRVGIDQIEDASISLAAGTTLGGEYSLPSDLTEPNQNAIARIASTAAVRTAPQGTIAISGPVVVIAGKVTAPAGTIDLEATSGIADLALTLQAGALVSAAAYNPPIQQLSTTGLPVGYTPLDAGHISLTARDLVVEKSALLDVSASDPVRQLLLSADGSYRRETVAGNPGEIQISFFDQFRLDGRLKGKATHGDMPGGTLVLEKNDTLTAYDLQARDLQTYIQAGFDDIALVSPNALHFSDSVDTGPGRKLTLDAPLISTADQAVDLRAPWIVLTNTFENGASASPVRQVGELNLSGDWIDIQGELILSGFDSVSLNARHDIRLADRLYTLGSLPDEWRGRLETRADMIINADRVYPTTQSVFSIVTGGDVTTLATVADPSTHPVYSADGDLALSAANILHKGRWVAPMGKLQLTTTAEDGRLYLDDRSLLATAVDARVNYGGLDDEAIVWLKLDKTSVSGFPNTVVEQAPATGVVLAGNEVILRDGAVVDVAGGGELFGYRFLPGTEGSTDPLKKEGRMVIVPGMTDALPGQAVFLEGNDRVDAGVYTVLPEAYAFLDDALIIEDLGPTAVGDGNAVLSKEGDALTVGHTLVAGTSLISSPSTFFSVRPAPDVLAEGNFTIKKMTAGDAGSFSIQGGTTILNGTLNAAALDGFTGGSLAFSSRIITTGATGARLPDGFFYRTPIPDELVGKLIIDAAAISEGGFDSVDVGDPAVTGEVRFEAGSVLTAANLTVAAADSIVVEGDSRLSASGDAPGGILDLVSPAGRVSIASSATLHATHDIRIDTPNLDLDGDIAVDNSTLHLIGDRIVVAMDGDGGGSTDDLIIDETLWNKISGIDTVGLASRSDILFLGDADLQAADTLILDADRIFLDTDAVADVSIAASTIHLQNTSLEKESYSDAGSVATGGGGSLELNADDLFIAFGELTDQVVDQEPGAGATNNLIIDGAAAITLRAANDLAVSGGGSLSIDGNLSIESAGILTALTETSAADGGATYTTADVTLISHSGTVSTRTNGNPAGTPNGYGGHLTLQGYAIDHAGVIHNPSGTIRLKATGPTTEDGVFLRDGSRLDVAGIQHAAGGGVFLESAQGSVDIATGAGVDVSAGAQGDAGRIVITAPAGDARIQGDLKGLARGGSGGDFSLDSDTNADFTAIAELLAAGGFSGNIDLRTHQGDLTVAEDDHLTAADIKLIADAGNVSIRGVLAVADEGHGGNLEIDAGGDIHLLDGSILDAGASGSDADGGQILLASQNGTVRFDGGAQMNVDGKGGGSDGVITLRASRVGNGLGMDLNGTIAGAATITAQGVEVYDGIRTIRKSGTSGDDSIVHMDTLVAEAASWLETLNFQHNLQGVDTDVLQVIPAIEIRSQDDLTVKEAIDFSQYAVDLPLGVLTLRSAGNLDINASMTDARTDVLRLREQTAVPSWGLDLVAGADLDSGDPLATDGSGRLVTGDGVLIYTEKAPIRLASAGDTELGATVSQDDPMTLTRMRYSIGSFSGPVSGQIGGDLVINDGGLQTATGDIRLTINGNLQLLRQGANFSAIRTIGQAPSFDPSASDSEIRFLLNSFWDYADGGGITLNVGGNIDGVPLATDAWDTSTRAVEGFNYHPVYSNGGIEAIVTMADGDLTIRAGDDIICAAGVFGRGDLEVIAGKNLDGRFLIGEGRASLNALGNFGTRVGLENQPVEAFDAQIDLVAQGRVELGTVLNPTIANQDYNVRWDLGYTQDSAATLTSVQGDVVLTGETRFYLATGSLKPRSRVLPATLTVHAAGDIVLENSFYLAPSATGNLALTAGGNIYSAVDNSGTQPRHTLAMSDAAPSRVYGYVEDDAEAFQLITSTTAHAEPLLHKNDIVLTTVHAGGDIRDLRLFVPKASQVIAEGDVADIFYHSQNIRLNDVTLISAGHDIRFSSGTDTTFQAGFEIGGPGSIIVAAGNSIDLGTTEGIRAVGNLFNQILPTPDEEAGDPPAALAVYAGLNLDPADAADQLDATLPFFDAIRQQGEAYSNALAEGEPDAAQQILDEVNRDTIDPFLAGLATGNGDINMVNSQIFTSGNAGDINIVATGDVNVGRSTFRASGDQGDNSGIYTTAGGSINIFVNHDLNVNESRVMTFGGGDITAWTQEGNINAGRGSKTVISTSSPTVDRSGDELKIVFTPPAVGSGVRALTFDPDGLEGPLTAPDIGDIFLFAPQGEIDAGEAGIAGKNIILGATQVVNVQNIEVGGTSVGVPDASASAASLGALAGAGTVSETSKIAEEQAALGSAKERFSKYVADLADTLVPKWLAVEVIGFGDPSESPAADLPKGDTDWKDKKAE